MALLIYAEVFECNSPAVWDYFLRKISLVIFDCDGVLVDSECLSAQVLVQTFAEIGVTIDRSFVFRHFLGHSFSSVAAKFARLHGTNVSDSFEADYRISLLRRFASELKPMPGIENVMDSLAVPFCVATGSSPLRVSKSLELAHLSSRVAGRVFTTSMVARGKPAPDVFLYVAEEMKVPPAECLVVEDSATGIEAANAAGMVVWQFAGGCHYRNGYLEGTPSLLVDRVFDRMDSFFDAAPQLKRAIGK
jgi:HAD superfamily hydrolase (TIGR01509 family)